MNCEHLIFMRDNLDLNQREMSEKLNGLTFNLNATFQVNATQNK